MFTSGEHVVSILRSRLRDACDAMSPFEDVCVHFVWCTQVQCRACEDRQPHEPTPGILISWASRMPGKRGELRFASQYVPFRESSFEIALPESAPVEVIVPKKKEKETFRQTRAREREERSIHPVKRPAKPAKLPPSAPVVPPASVTPPAKPDASTGQLEPAPKAGQAKTPDAAPELVQVEPVVPAGPEAANTQGDAVRPGPPAVAAWAAVGARPDAAPVAVSAAAPLAQASEDAVRMLAMAIVSEVKFALNDPVDGDHTEAAVARVEALLRPSMPAVKPAAPSVRKSSAGPPAGYTAEQWSELTPARRAWATRRAAAGGG